MSLALAQGCVTGPMSLRCPQAAPFRCQSFTCMEHLCSGVHQSTGEAQAGKQTCCPIQGRDLKKISHFWCKLASNQVVELNWMC